MVCGSKPLSVERSSGARHNQDINRLGRCRHCTKYLSSFNVEKAQGAPTRAWDRATVLAKNEQRLWTKRQAFAAWNISIGRAQWIASHEDRWRYRCSAPLPTIPGQRARDTAARQVDGAEATNIRTRSDSIEPIGTWIDSELDEVVVRQPRVKTPPDRAIVREFENHRSLAVRTLHRRRPSRRRSQPHDQPDPVHRARGRRGVCHRCSSP